MKKLEIKHLSPYAPFELKWHLLGIGSGVETITNMIGLNFKENNILFDASYLPLNNHLNHGGVVSKPILRPLSDLFVLLNENHAHYTIIEQLSDLSDSSLELDFIEYLELLELLSDINEADFTKCPWSIMCQLFELHFDVFGLIEEGLAIDINTCLLYTSPSPRDRQKSRMPSSA